MLRDCRGLCNLSMTLTFRKIRKSKNADSSNLEILCVKCHGEEHAHYKNTNRYKVNV